MSGIEVLVTGSIVFDGERIIRDGYVFIREGKVEALGESPVPEDYTYASLVLGGRGRIVVPGLTALADVALYPLRLLSLPMDERVRLYESLDPESLFKLSLPGVYELHMNGVSTIIVESTSYSLPLELASKVGGLYGLALPTCIGPGLKPHPRLVGIIRVGGEGCGGDWDVLEESGRGYSRAGRVLALFDGVSYSFSGQGDPYEESSRLRDILDLGPPGIRVGSRAEIAIYDSTRPPLILMDKAPIDAIKRIYLAGARVESLISGEDVLVDNGEHLWIVEKHLEEARKLGSRLLGSAPGLKD